MGSYHQVDWVVALFVDVFASAWTFVASDCTRLNSVVEVGRALSKAIVRWVDFINGTCVSSSLRGCWECFRSRDTRNFLIIVLPLIMLLCSGCSWLLVM